MHVLGGSQRLTFYMLGLSENFFHESRRARRYKFVDMWNAKIGVRMKKLWRIEVLGFFYKYGKI